MVVLWLFHFQSQYFLEMASDFLSFLILNLCASGGIYSAPDVKDGRVTQVWTIRPGIVIGQDGHTIQVWPIRDNEVNYRKLVSATPFSNQLPL